MISDDDVATFVSMTSADPNQARSYIEMAGGDLQQAINLFLEMGGGPSSSPVIQPGSAPAAPPAMPAAGVVDADVAAEVAAVAAAAGISTSMQDVEEEVRAPIASYQDQLVNPDVERRRMQEHIAADAASMSKRMAFDRPMDTAGAGSGEQPDVDMTRSNGQAINQLFSAPSYNETKPYLETVEQARNEQKWVLVNIQQAEVFASHQLNRDVWSDDTIKEIVTGSCLFWQRDDKSAEGSNFCQYYKCGHQLPHIAIVDPRTKRCVKSWDGRKWVESLAAAEYLFSILDQHSMSSSPKMSPLASPDFRPSQDPSGASGDMELTGLPPVAAAAAAAPAPAPAAAVCSTAAEPEIPKEPIAEMPPEPADGGENLKVSFRLPSGQRLTRRFLPDDTIETMLAVASASTENPASVIDLSTQFPKRMLRDLEGGLVTKLKDAQVAGNVITVSIRST